MHINFEFKARHDDIDLLERLLLETSRPKFIGEDHQIDTYFHVPNGRLKLREGNIEQALIFYQRNDSGSAKQSNVILYKPEGDKALKEILVSSLGAKVVVDKLRKIYFVDNVKFHFDRVLQLGTFVEVEAIDADGSIGIETLKAQCAHYERLFSIREQDHVNGSYSDLLLEKIYSTGGR